MQNVEDRNQCRPFKPGRVALLFKVKEMDFGRGPLVHIEIRVFTFIMLKSEGEKTDKYSV